MQSQNEGLKQSYADGAANPPAGLPPVSPQGSHPVDYFGLKGALPATATTGSRQQDQQDNSSDLDALRYKEENRNSENGDDDDEIDGADADASIRPITPSSIDASSSFTGSTSLHSLAPTSRTFKSFRTGHSKTSASTKPTLLGPNGTSISIPSGGHAVGNNAPSVSSPTSNAHMQLNDASASPPNSVVSLGEQRRDGSAGQPLRLQSDKQREREKALEATIDEPGTEGSTLGMVDMHDPEANRIATSLHGAEGTISTSPRANRGPAELPGVMTLQPDPLRPSRHGPKASPLRNSFVGPMSNLAVAPALSAADEESESGSQVPQQTTPRDTDWAAKQDGDGPDHLQMPEAHRVESSGNMRSSASITFSKLPPATPSSISSAQLYSAPGSPGRLSSYTRHNTDYRDEDDEQDRAEDADGIYHYPRHSAPDPRNNPRASSPPPDNASMLTLASSTGGRAPSVYTAASRYRDGFAGGNTGGGSGSIGGAPSIVDTAGNRYRTTANEDASIRAIAPSRRESTDSIGSKWSAAILSQKEGSYHAPSGSAQAGNVAGDTTPDNASFKRRTPSLRTVATTASSYYAAPIAPSTELKA